MASAPLSSCQPLFTTRISHFGECFSARFFYFFLLIFRDFSCTGTEQQNNVPRVLFSPMGCFFSFFLFTFQNAITRFSGAGRIGSGSAILFSMPVVCFTRTTPRTCAHAHQPLFKKKKNTKIGRIRRNPYWFDRWQPNDGRGRPRVHFISFLFFCRARRLQFIVLTKIRPEIGAQNLIELTGKTISIRVNATFELSKFVEKTRNDVIPKFSTFEGLAFICL